MRASFTATLQVAPLEWLTFRNPVLVLRAEEPRAVGPTLADVESLTRDRGLHAVGYVAYEAGAAFGLPVVRLPERLPLVCFGLFADADVARTGQPPADGAYEIGALQPSVDRERFGQAFERIKAALAAGDSYQANYTFRLRGAFSGDPATLFADLVAAQRGGYSAYLAFDDLAICSASPELFFELTGRTIVTRPMKGTARRGRTLAEDRASAAALAGSPKERAENVMIVDMMRNDLGRVADTGSVDVPELFSVERFPNVWQMTSLVRARTDAALRDIFAALHPSASVTGAPKVRTMALLADLEDEPRGVYTGAIGYVPPSGLARFNVAIRTAVVDRGRGSLTFGVGSGVVWDSNADDEYDECLLKGTILTRPTPHFQLLETMRWTEGEGFWLLARHLRRLSGSADYFDVPVSMAAIDTALAQAVAGATGTMRVRLLVSLAGEVRVETYPYAPWREPVRVRLSPRPVDPSDRFLCHKTTNRRVYDEARASVADGDDVLLWNTRGEVTEASLANVVIEIDGERVTPPVSCGLLPGTHREAWLEEGRVVERVVRVADLARATGVWLLNAVQGERVAEICPE